MTRPADFAQTVRRGRRVGTPSIVLHARVRDGDAPGQVGFIVSKAVGGAVVRNRVKRRLRHLVAHRLVHIPAGCHVVVRALAAAGGLSSAELGRDLDTGLTRLKLAPA